MNVYIKIQIRVLYTVWFTKNADNPLCMDLLKFWFLEFSYFPNSQNAPLVVLKIAYYGLRIYLKMSKNRFRITALLKKRKGVSMLSESPCITPIVLLFIILISLRGFLLFGRRRRWIIIVIIIITLHGGGGSLISSRRPVTIN